MMMRFKTGSDIASVKVGNESFTVQIPNGYGDGTTIVEITDKDDKDPSFNFFTIIKGENINIYSYDCGNEIEHTISGEFFVYIGEESFGMTEEGFYDIDPVVLFVKQ